MTKTSPIIILAMSDAILSSVSSPDAHSRADINDLVTGDAIRSLKWASYEPDQWLLDGSFHFAPDPAHIGFVSDEISLVDKSFTSDPVLTLTLDAVVDIEQGITLEFSDISGDYATAVNVEYQDAGTTPIDDDDYIPTGYNFFAEAPTLPVADVKYIVITFSETSEAYRHIKLLDVYVDGVLFDNSDIEKLNTVEEIDIAGVRLPVSSCDFALSSETGDFSLIDPSGFYAALKKDLRFDVYETIDEIRQYMGRFYLSDWETKNEKYSTFSAFNIIERIGRTKYLGDVWGLGILFVDIIADMLAGLDYSTDSFWDSYGTRGWIPITNLRDGVREISFGLTSVAALTAGLSAIVQCNRSKDININTILQVGLLATWDFEITKAEVANLKFELKSSITSVKLVSHEYYASSINIDLYNSPTTLDAGDYLIIFRKPSHNLGITGGTITSSGANHAWVNVASTNSIVITGDEYTDQLREDEEIIISDFYTENVINIGEATLIGANLLQSKLPSLSLYYQLRHIAKFRMFAPVSIKPGDSILLYTGVTGKSFSGYVTRMSSNLSGSFVADIEAEGEIITTP